MSESIRNKGAEVRKYPEHEKLKALGGKNQAVGEFVMEFLAEKGIVLAEYHTHPDGRRACGCHGTELYLTHISIRKLIAEFFEIDEDKLEAEKRAMLDELRGAK